MVFELQTDQNFYVDMGGTCIASNLKLVRSRAFEIHDKEEVEKEHKKEPEKAAVVEETEEEAPIPAVTHVNKSLKGCIQFFALIGRT